MYNNYYDIHLPQLFPLSGCQNTPAKGSRYCTLHCNTAMVFRDDTLPGEMMNNVSNCNEPGSLIVRVVNEKTTRQGNIYEVIKKLILILNKLMVPSNVIR